MEPCTCGDVRLWTCPPSPATAARAASRTNAPAPPAIRVQVTSSPTINISGAASDPAEFARMVLDALSRRDRELVAIIEAELRRQLRTGYY